MFLIYFTRFSSTHKCCFRNSSWNNYWWYFISKISLLLPLVFKYFRCDFSVIFKINTSSIIWHLWTIFWGHSITLRLASCIRSLVALFAIKLRIFFSTVVNEVLKTIVYKSLQFVDRIKKLQLVNKKIVNIYWSYNSYLNIAR